MIQAKTGTTGPVQGILRTPISPPIHRIPIIPIILPLLCLFTLPALAAATGPVGYYRSPTLHGDDLYFQAEGDLWHVSLQGGQASRLTSHPGTEDSPAVSPDGVTLAFTAAYDGNPEIYTLPVAGGTPTRRTWLGARRIAVAGWTPDGRILAATDAFSTLPQVQLFTLDIATPAPVSAVARLPLEQAADGCFDDTGRILFFTRLPFQGSHTKRYRGGTAQNLWRFTSGDAEALPLTADYTGTSRSPLWWQGRVYFVSDRDGTLNLWSMLPDGKDLRQHTRHRGWDVLDPALSKGRVVYQLGADLRVLDLAAGTDRVLPITLASDLDQTREQWVSKPTEYLSAVHLSPDGDRVVLTARGVVFTAPARQGRLAQVTHKPGVRFRNARFMPDGKNLLALSDESGETEFWLLPADGTGPGAALTTGADILRWEGLPSPDGKRIAHTDKNQRLWITDTASRTSQKVDESPVDRIDDLAWSPDSQWLAYVVPTGNTFREIRLWNAASASRTAVTTNRFDSSSPAWSPDGKWLYFLSNRNLTSVVRAPWGHYAPQPYLDKPTKVYTIPLTEGLRSPFAARDELQSRPVPVKEEPGKAPTSGGNATAAPETATKAAEKPASGVKAVPPAVRIDLEGIRDRLQEVPVPPGRYDNLAVGDKALFWLSSHTGEEKRSIQSLNIAAEGAEVKTVCADVRHFELSGDGKKLLLRKQDTLYVVDAAHGPATLDKRDVPLAGWTLALDPRQEWRQMLTEAWRLERDYFYDPGMHGVDWKGMLQKYLPLVDRLTCRGELSDLLARMVSELSALHIYVYGGDARKGADTAVIASLGADLERDEAKGGWRVARLRRFDPDNPAGRPPLAQPDVNVGEGDVIESINGVPLLTVPDPAVVLRNQAGKQVLLRVFPAGSKAGRDVVAVPVTAKEDADLRYTEWELTRRQAVETLGGGRIGYVHLRAMGDTDYAQWARDFFPVFDRDGLIVDVRHNNGGNIDSWILGQLLRKAWSFWSQRVGPPSERNMQYAFRGHAVVLCDEFTASDGEAFAEGFRRLGIGTVIGKRTWGGEIWLSSSNFLVDGGIATAAENGVFGPEGQWLIEGHGVEPDLVVDNLPHAAFQGKDAQLEAAVAHLQKLIKEKPVPPVTTPRYPDKSAPDNAPPKP